MNSKARKIFAILILTLLLVISTTSYYGIKGIDNLAYVVAIGLDKGDNENLKLRFTDRSLPTSGDGGSSSSSQSASVVVDSIDCPSISTGINLF